MAETGRLALTRRAVPTIERFTELLAAGGRFHRKVLDPLFFGTLNTRAQIARALLLFEPSAAITS